MTLVSMVMGSQSDLETMRHAAEVLDLLKVPYEMRILSAHRVPDSTAEYAKGAAARGVRVIIAGAGGAAHLPGVVAASTTLPVLGVPMQGQGLGGLDALYAIVQMPRGIPVGTLAIGKAGAANAGLLAAQIIALSDPALAQRLSEFRAKLRTEVNADDQKLGEALKNRKSDQPLADTLKAAGFKLA